MDLQGGGENPDAQPVAKPGGGVGQGDSKPQKTRGRRHENEKRVAGNTTRDDAKRSRHDQRDGDAGEDVLQQHSEELQSIRNGLRGVLDTWRSKKSAIFNHNSWFGGASSAAETKVDAELEKMEALDKRLSEAIEFYNNARQAIIDAYRR